MSDTPRRSPSPPLRSSDEQRRGDPRSTVRLDSIEQAIEDIAAGKAVVVVGLVVWLRASRTVVEAGESKEAIPA